MCSAPGQGTQPASKLAKNPRSLVSGPHLGPHLVAAGHRGYIYYTTVYTKSAHGLPGARSSSRAKTKMHIAATTLLILAVICTLSTASARRGLAAPSHRVPVPVRVLPVYGSVSVSHLLSRLPPSAHPLPVTAEPLPAPVTAAARRVSTAQCVGALVVASLLFGVSIPSLAAPDPSTTRSQPASVTTPLRLSYWDILGRVQRLEDTSFTKEDAREMEAARKKEREEDKEDLKKDMQKMAELTQTNFMITSFLTVLSLFLSLAANEGFTAKVFPPQ